VPPLSSDPITIFGHRNPDADSICSALAYADFKSRTEPAQSYRAARCGNSNARIDAILDHFGVALPPFIGEVTPRLREVMVRDVATVTPKESCAEALDKMERHEVRALPVVDEAGGLLGMVTVLGLGGYFIPRLGRAREMRRVDSSLRSIVRALSGDALHLVEPDLEETLFVRVGAMDIRSFDRLSGEEPIDPRRSVIVVGDRWDIQQRSIQMGVRLLVVSGGFRLDDEVLSQAREAGVSVVVSPYDSATTAWTIRAATRVERVMVPDTVEFSPDLPVSEVRRRTATLEPGIFMVTDDERKLLGVFTRRDLLRPSRTKIVLVDHNELSQAVPGAEEVEIVEVVDHHRLGDLRTQDPILFINRPVGSTCTIVADLYRKAGLEPSIPIAGILLGGLIADTLNLQSPTSTSVDREILEWLETLAGVSGAEIGEIIFSSGSVVGAKPAAEVLALDRKRYEEGGVHFTVSQVEEIGFSEFWARSEDLMIALRESVVAEGVSFATLLVTDVKSQDSLLLVAGDPAVIAGISYPAVEEGEIYRLSGVVSRKKQLIPFLTGILRGVPA